MRCNRSESESRKSVRLPPLEWRNDPSLLLTSYRQRKACFARDGGKCRCGAVGGPWNADHDIALHAIPPSIGFPEALKYWRIDNLVTRCIECHQRKTTAEAKFRGKVRRLHKKAQKLEDKWKRKVPQRAEYKTRVVDLGGRAVRIKAFKPPAVKRVK